MLNLVSRGDHSNYQRRHQPSHGAAFWYHQNAAMDAIPYTYPITTMKPKLVGNTYGGSFGGSSRDSPSL